MKRIKQALQILFFALILTLFVSRSASSGFSHDENQFIAAGQLLAYRGLLPYVDYPYTHVPYGTGFYALTAALSPDDFLAGRLLNSLAWFVSAILIVRIIRAFARSSGLAAPREPTFAQLFAEFVIVFIFLNDPIMGHIAGAALNHSLATLFGLIALWLFIQSLRATPVPAWKPFGAGVAACLAGLIRLNYASLVILLLGLWLLTRLSKDAPSLRSVLPPFLEGVFLAAIPALILVVLAPAQFYYGNLLYVRLNTIYYQQLVFRLNMTWGSKLSSFVGLVTHMPIEFVLYGSMAAFSIVALVRYLKDRSLRRLEELGVAGFAVTLALTAFAPTPTQPQYYFAPLPFMLITLGILGHKLQARSMPAYLASAVVVLLALFVSVRIPSPIAEIAFLSKPSEWVPLQVHNFDEGLKKYVPNGRILALLPMLPLEAGYDAYGFTATGSFSWRTSPLLTPERRAYYGVTSPEELPQLLASEPPSAILTDLESSNDGFVRNDLGGLERPFVIYATEHGYKPVSLAAPFLERTVTLWVKGP